MNDLQILEAVERYISGQMSSDERVYFEQLRKTDPEIDQLVVEHTFFMQQFDRFENTKKLKNRLNDVHIELAERNQIRSPKLKGKAKVVYLFNRYKKVTAIAASIAGITALTFSAMVWSISPNKKNNADIKALNREISALKNQNSQQNREINNIKQNIPATINYTKGGTGFLIDEEGYIVTNAHIIENARNIAVQNAAGKDMTVNVVFVDAERDLAILKIADTAFRAQPIPFRIKRSSADIADHVYTLGYPRNDIVYGEGYLAAVTGFNGDTLTCQIAIAANPGNSGGPVLNRNGEVIGILSTKQTSADGVVFAIQSKYIHHALEELQRKDSTYKHLRIPASTSLKGMEKTQQVKKISEYVYMVKVS
jgi:serine protease Do